MVILGDIAPKGSIIREFGCVCSREAVFDDRFGSFSVARTSDRIEREVLSHSTSIQPYPH